MLPCAVNVRGACNAGTPIYEVVQVRCDAEHQKAAADAWSMAGHAKRHLMAAGLIVHMLTVCQIITLVARSCC